MEANRTRLYTRYDFSAAAEIISSGAEMRSRVTNISFGGCRLLTNGKLPIGAQVTVKIHTPTDHFEATAQVVHSTPSDAGVMFGNIAPQSLLVLRKWTITARPRF
jgi:hypothetical protein